MSAGAPFMRSPRRSCATELRAAARCDASSSARATKASHRSSSSISACRGAAARKTLMHSLPLAPQPLQRRAHRGRIPARSRRAAVPRPPARLRGRARAPSRAPAFGVLGRPLCDVGLAVAPLVLLVQPVVVGNLNLIATKVSEAVAAAPPTEERLFEGSVTTF